MRSYRYNIKVSGNTSHIVFDYFVKWKRITWQKSWQKCKVHLNCPLRKYSHVENRADPAAKLKSAVLNSRSSRLSPQYRELCTRLRVELWSTRTSSRFKSIPISARWWRSQMWGVKGWGTTVDAEYVNAEKLYSVLFLFIIPILIGVRILVDQQKCGRVWRPLFFIIKKDFSMINYFLIKKSSF